jgi:hypothetical protein
MNKGWEPYSIGQGSRCWGSRYSLLDDTRCIWFHKSCWGSSLLHPYSFDSPVQSPTAATFKRMMLESCGAMHDWRYWLWPMALSCNSLTIQEATFLWCYQIGSPQLDLHMKKGQDSRLAESVFLSVVDESNQNITQQCHPKRSYCNGTGD